MFQLEVSDRACAEEVHLNYQAADATVEGWEIVESMLEEGQEVLAVSNLNNPDPDSVVQWRPSVPCDDTWHVWIRGLDQNTSDSF